METLNILTRTSNRPNGFKRCYNSIKNQTYKKINHIVSCDNEKDLNYLNNYDDIEVIKIYELTNFKNRIGNYMIWNTYFNHMITQSKDGWIIFLDDDDYLHNENVIEEIINEDIKDKEVVIFQMFFNNSAKGLREPMPYDEFFESKEVRCNYIGTSCFMAKKEFLIKHNIKWTQRKGGDCSFIKQACNKAGVNKTKWIKKVVTVQNEVGDGKGLRKDIIN